MVAVTAVRMLPLPGRGELLLGPLDASPLPQLSRPFAVLLPAFDPGERTAAAALLGTLLERGCAQLCTVGPEAEQLHDDLDSLLEERGRLEVVTTWHADTSEAAEYFLLAAGRSVRALLALVAAHPPIVSALEALARDLQR